MPNLKTNLQLLGVNRDIDPTAVPLEYWTDVRNVLFSQRKATQAPFYKDYIDMPEQPFYLKLVEVEGINYFFVGTERNVYTVDENLSILKRTPTDLDSGSWYLSTTGSSVLMTNGKNTPVVLKQGEDDFTPIPNYPTNEGCKYIRPFKNFLLAANLDKNGDVFPYNLRWSNAVEAGQLPDNWDSASTESLAGEISLSEDPSPIVALEPLKDRMMVYKERSVYSLNYIGGNFIFNVKRVFSDVGAVNDKCVVEFDNKHFFVDIGAFYVTDGVSRTEVGNNIVHERFMKELDYLRTEDIFVVKNSDTKEVWVCYSTINNNGLGADRALVWNWRDDLWSVIDLPNFTYGTTGAIDVKETTGITWESLSSQTWDDVKLVWNPGRIDVSRKTFFVRYNENRIYTETFEVSDASFTNTNYLQRTGLNMGTDDIKALKWVTPVVHTAGTVKLFVGSEINQGEGYKWRGPYTLTQGKKTRIACRTQGRFIGFRFESEKFPDIGSILLEYEVNGRR